MKILNFIISMQFIFMPSYWYMLYPYSKKVDEIILQLLEKHEFKNISEMGYTAELNNCLIWIENKPYAAIRLYETNLQFFRPSRLTILKALNKLKAAKKLEEQNAYLRILKDNNLK